MAKQIKHYSILAIVTVLSFMAGMMTWQYVSPWKIAPELVSVFHIKNCLPRFATIDEIIKDCSQNQ